MREMPKRHTKTRLEEHQQSPVFSNYLVFEILPEISPYIQYCILNLGTEHKINTWGRRYRELSISMFNLLLLLQKNSSPVISKIEYITYLRI